MRRGQSCKIKRQIKNQQKKFDNYGVHQEFSKPKKQQNKKTQQASWDKKVQTQHRNQITIQNKGNQEINQKKKNLAKIYHQQSEFFNQKIQKKNQRTQEQLSKKNNIQSMGNGTIQTNYDIKNQTNQQYSPLYQKTQLKSTHSKQIQQSPQHQLDKSMILMSRVSVQPEQNINQNEKRYTQFNWQFNQRKVIQQKEDDCTNRQLLIILERLMSEQKKQIQAQQRRYTQASASMSKISSQLQFLCNKIWTQIFRIKQTIKIQNTTTLLQCSQSLFENEKAEMQKNLQRVKKDNTEMRAELNRIELFQKQKEEKIRQQYIKMKIEYESQMKEDQESRIRKINDQHQRQIQNLKSQYQQQRRQKEELLKMQNQQRDIFSSNLLNFSNIQHAKSFIKKQIESFQSKTVDIFELLFQKDHRNSNFGLYMNAPTFPFLLLILTQKNNIFGAYSQGFQTYKSFVNSEQLLQKQRFKAFLFNVNNKQIFTNDRETSLSAVQYMDSMLRFGNSEIVIKNNNFEIIKVNVNNIFGERYYTIKYRRFLTGQEGDQIRIKRLQIHQVHFKKG